MTLATPRGMRLHIGIFGRRNVGKSSLLNAITGREVSIVSDVAGTTTDPVEKAMELLPFGPVLFIDTAGLDDVGDVGDLRVERTQKVLGRIDVCLVVSTPDEWTEYENNLLDRLALREIPAIVVINKWDQEATSCSYVDGLIDAGQLVVRTSAVHGTGLDDLRQALIDCVPDSFLTGRPIISDLIGPGEMVVLVAPIDKEAPRGRLILPQVQTIRDLLDRGAQCLVVRDTELTAALNSLKKPPQAVVTDSQAFAHVAEVTPEAIPLTSFSILFSRLKGDLVTQAAGAAAIDHLVPSDRVLIAEHCTHHPIEDDIGRIKIPRWLRKRVGGELVFDHVRGHDFPDDLSPYRLVIHCGACTANRREVLTRIQRCLNASVPVTNYGMTIAHCFGILERALGLFPEAARAYTTETTNECGTDSHTAS